MSNTLNKSRRTRLSDKINAQATKSVVSKVKDVVGKVVKKK